MQRRTQTQSTIEETPTQPGSQGWRLRARPCAPPRKSDPRLILLRRGSASKYPGEQKTKQRASPLLAKAPIAASHIPSFNTTHHNPQFSFDSVFSSLFFLPAARRPGAPAQSPEAAPKPSLQRSSLCFLLPPSSSRRATRKPQQRDDVKRDGGDLARERRRMSPACTTGAPTPLRTHAVALLFFVFFVACRLPARACFFLFDSAARTC